MPNVAEQVISDVKEAQVKYNLTVLDEPAAKALKEQVISIAKPDHRIKQLVCKLPSKICNTITSNSFF